MKGFHYACKSMKRGEISWFKFSPDYHFGQNGVPEADPPIPPNTSLYYKMILHDYKIRIKKAG